MINNQIDLYYNLTTFSYDYIIDYINDYISNYDLSSKEVNLVLKNIIKYVKIEQNLNTKYYKQIKTKNI